MSANLASSWRRVSRRNPCPICHSPDWCSVTSDGALAACMRVAEGAFRIARNGAHLHRLTADVLTRPRALEALAVAGAPLADPVRLDAVLRALERHPLAALARADRDGLARRGLSAAAILRAGYWTLPTQGRSRIAREVAEAHEVAGVPGFYWSEHNAGYRTVAGKAGLAIPVRDHAGRVRGAQLRPHAQGEGPQGGAKYVWLSSANRTAGTGSGAPLHWTLAGDTTEALWVTEGALKADVAAHLSGHRFLAIAGVGMGARIAEELLAVEWPREKPIVLAFDYADFRDKSPVRRGLVAAGRALLEAGFAVRVATWDPTRGKGVDDALLAGAEVQVETWERFTGEKPVAVRPGPLTIPPARETLTVAEAEAAISRTVREVARDLPLGLTILQTPPGVGKTLTTIRTLATARLHGAWGRAWSAKTKAQAPVRVAILCDTRAKVEEVAADLLAAGLPSKQVAILAGRDAENCRRIVDVRRLGAARHSPEYEACRDCQHGAGCAYLAQRETARDAWFVVACKEAVLCSSRSDLAAFGIVVCDESFAHELLEVFALELADVQRWRSEFLAERDERLGPEFRHLLDVLEQALSGRGRDPWEPILPVLRAVAEVLGHDLGELVRAILSGKRPNGGRYSFESPQERSGGLRATLPMRGFRDVAEAIAEELDGEDRSDTRLWRDNGEAGSVPSLRVYRPRRELRATLAKRTVLLLDATPEPDLPAYTATFGEAVTTREFAVEEPVEVVQLGNALRQVEGVRKAIRERMVAEVGEGEFVAVVTRKRIAEAEAAANTNPRLRIGAFGRDHRASNAFAGARAVIVEDRWAEPAETARAWVQAWRFGNAPESDPDEYSPIAGQASEGRRAGAGGEFDPDVSAYVEARWGAEVRQAIGRARACRHATSEAPVRVVVESRVPLPGVTVSRLCSAWEFLGWRDPQEKRSENIRGETWEATNLRQRAEAESRIRRAVYAYLAEHDRFPSVCELKRRVGGRKDVLARVLGQVRDGLGARSPHDSTSTCTYASRGDRPPREPDGGPPNGLEPPVERLSGHSDLSKPSYTPNVVQLEPVGPQAAEDRGRPPRLSVVACRGVGA